MKKIWIIFLSLIAVFAAASCTNNTREETGANTESVPVIETEFEVCYGTVDTQVELPECAAYVDGKAVPTTLTMQAPNGEVVDVNSGFTPEETGEYVLSVFARNGEKTGTKEVYYYVEENADVYKNKMASFDKAYGVKHNRQATGVQFSYSTEFQYGEETGSTKISVDTRKGAEILFSIGNLHIKDMSDYEGFVFYVYNDTDGHVNLYMNWANGVTLMPRRWTQVAVNADGLERLEKSANTLLKENFSITSMDGMEIELVKTATTDYVYDLYFSAMYALEEEIVLEPETVVVAIDEFLQNSAFEANEVSRIEEQYAKLTDENKRLVTNYKAFCEALTAHYKDQVELENRKALYFDAAVGAKQFSHVDGAIVSPSTLYKYGDEAGSTEVSIYGFDAKLTIGYPFVEEVQGYDVLKMRFYNPTLTDCVLFNRLGGDDHTLKAGEWTEVTFDISELSSLQGAVIWIYSGDWYQGLERGVKLYMSAAYLGYTGTFYEPDELVQKIGAITSQTTLEELQALEENYEKYIEDEKALVSNYDDLIDAIYEKIKQNHNLTDEPEYLVYFNKAAGLEQVTVQGGSGAYVSDVYFEDEGGATRFDVSEFDLKITLDYVLDDDKMYETVQFSVYNDSGRDIAFFGAGGHFIGEEKDVTLSAKAWTTVTLNVNNAPDCRGKTLWFYSGDWYQGIEGTTLYISAVKLTYADMGTKIVSFTLDNYGHKLSANGILTGSGAPEGHAELSYDRQYYGFDGKEGSVRITTQSWYADVVLSDATGIFEYEQIRFAIYNANAVSRTFIDQGQISGEAKKIVLAPNEWTVITLDIASGFTSLNGYKIRIYDGGGWGSIVNNVFYLSDIYALGKIEQETETLVAFSASSIPLTTANGTLEYDNEYKVGAQGGSLKLTVGTNAQFYADLTFTAGVDLCEYTAIRFVVFAAYNGLETSGALNTAQRYLKTYTALGGAEIDHKLTKNAWTTVILPLNGTADNLNGNKIRFYASGWGKFNGDVYYIADIVGVKGDVLVDFSADTISVSTSNGVLDYDNEYKVGGQDGALKLTVGTNGQFYADLTFKADVDISAYTAIRFIVYAAYNGLEGSGEVNVAQRYLKTYADLGGADIDHELTKGVWTSVTLPLEGTATNLNGNKIRFYASGWGNFDGDIYYIADIIGVK